MIVRWLIRETEYLQIDKVKRLEDSFKVLSDNRLHPFKFLRFVLRKSCSVIEYYVSNILLVKISHEFAMFGRSFSFIKDFLTPAIYVHIKKAKFLAHFFNYILKTDIRLAKTFGISEKLFIVNFL